MTTLARLRFDLLLCGALAVALLGAPMLARADEPGPAAISAPPADAPELEHTKYWRDRADAARARVAEAQTRLDEANGAVSRMQRRNHPRGEARQALRAEQQRAQTALEETTRQLEVELPDEARAAGAHQSWLRARP